MCSLIPLLLKLLLFVQCQASKNSILYNAIIQKTTFFELGVYKQTNK